MVIPTDEVQDEVSVFQHIQQQLDSQTSSVFVYIYTSTHKYIYTHTHLHIDKLTQLYTHT